MSKPVLDWIVVNTVARYYRCTRCGREESLVLPSPATAFVLRGKAFIADHRNCQSMTREVTDGPHPG